MESVISVQGLGKKYQLKHKGGQGAYRSLREELLQFPKRLFSKNEVEEEFWALKSVSFDVMPGDRIGIIGHNGAGKSTLLKLLSRITEPSTGKITMRGRVASLLEVGTGFHPELTGRENIFLNGAVLGMTRSEVLKKFDEIVDFAGVEKFLDTPVKRYSSGMYVRLAFSVAAHLEPDILVVDEVLAVGDAEFQKKCLGKMEEVSQADGRAVIFVSHDMSAMQYLCSKGILLSSGQVEFSGKMSSVIDRYSIGIDSDFLNGKIKLDELRTKKYSQCLFDTLFLLNEKREFSNTVRMGESCSLYVTLKNTEFVPEADYCIAILDSLGRWVCSYATWMYAKSVNNPKYLKLEIDSIKLSPGQYSIYLSSADHMASIYLDRIEQAGTLHVLASDIFGTGKEYSADCGVVLHDGAFEIVDETLNLGEDIG